MYNFHALLLMNDHTLFAELQKVDDARKRPARAFVSRDCDISVSEIVNANLVKETRKPSPEMKFLHTLLMDGCMFKNGLSIFFRVLEFL